MIKGHCVQPSSGTTSVRHRHLFVVHAVLPSNAPVHGLRGSAAFGYNGIFSFMCRVTGLLVVP